MKKAISLLDYIIYLLLLMYLLVDTCAGILAMRGISNIGQPYKMLVFSLMLIALVLKRDKKVFYIILSILLMIVSLLNISISTDTQFSTTFTFALKIICIYTFYLYFYESEDLNRIDTIFKINYLIFIINIILGFLGFAGKGTYTYNGESVGTVGFFIAGNEVTYLFCCLTFYFMITIRNRKMFLYIFTFIIGCLIGTKTCILSSLLMIIIDSCFAIENKKIRHLYIVLMVSLSIVLLIILFNVLNDNPLIQMLIFKFNQQKKGSNPILNALLSGRADRIPVMDELFNNKFSLKTFLFGIGVPFTSIIVRLEMDFFEVFYYLGFVFLTTLIMFYLCLFYKCGLFENGKIFWFDLLCVFISFFVGHVVYSVMGGIFFSIINSRKILEYGNKKIGLNK